MARTLSRLGLYKADPAALGRARDAAAEAMRLWPALDGNALIAATLIDEAGLAGDAKAWIAARRMLGASSALAKLVADHAPLAAKILAAKPWADVVTYARADTRRPELGDLRLARVLGDPTLEARTKAVLDDKLERLGLELTIVIDPTDPNAKQDLAELDKR